MTWLKRSWLSGIMIALLIIAFGLRLYKIDTPLADWHSFRQADTASVTREYVKNGVDLLRPRYHDISNIQSGEFNPEGWRMVEFPVINGLLAVILQAQPSLDLVVTSRIASVMATIIAMITFGWLIWRLNNPATALVATAVWTFMPYAIYYGRVILPEPFVLMFIGLALVSWYAWLKKYQGRDGWLILTALTGALALLVKPTAVFFAPTFIGLMWQFPERLLLKGKLNFRNLLKLTVSFVLAVLPVIWWRSWILNFPTGIPVSDWLLNGNGIRLKPAWWRWLFADRIGRMMFGYWGAPLTIIGLAMTLPTSVSLIKNKVTKNLPPRLGEILSYLQSWFKNQGAILGLVAGMMLYLVVFASGNVQHDYYQIILIPVMAWLWALGAVGLIRWAPTRLQTVGMATGLIVIWIFSNLFAWYFIKDLYNINNWAIVRAGTAVERVTSPDALVIAPYMGDTAFLFQTNRRGWPLGFDIDEKIEQGADFYVSTSKDDEVGELRQQFPVVEETDDYIIFDLRSGQ